jgi:hypothetical protein
MIVSNLHNFLCGLNTKQLRLKAKLYNIKVSTLKKKELVELIVKSIAAKIIQRRFTKHKSYTDICLISLDPITYPWWRRKIIDSNGIKSNKYIYYNLRPLAEYLISSGNFKDPYDNAVYTNQELESIDKAVKLNKLKIPKSVVVSKNNPEYYRKQKVNDEHVFNLVEQIRYVFCIIRNKIEDVAYEYEDILKFQSQLIRIYLPDASTNIAHLNKKSSSSRIMIFTSIRKLIDEINLTDRKIVNYLKKMISTWIDSEERKYLS